MNIYLDIDGVLLTKLGEPAPHSLELLKYLAANHAVFWLTTHCHSGENRAPEHLYPKFPPEAKAYIDKILPTNWGSWKTDAIDFSQDFRWLDDNIYQPEYEALKNHGCLERLIKINLQENPLRLKEVLSCLKVISNSKFENIYHTIDANIFEFAKSKTKDTKFTFDVTSSQEIDKKEERLEEIGRYVYAGMFLACRNGLYDYRREIRDSIIRIKLKEFADDNLDELLKDYNIRFQVSDFMVDAIHEWRREVVK